LVKNLTIPIFVAYKVSSAPRLTFLPGLNLVPRCLIMIEPGFTFCPAKSFTPKRLEAESRPNCVDPPDLR